MDTNHGERREFLRRLTSLGAAGVIAGWRPRPTHSGQASGEPEGNPQLILERREAISLVPMLIMQGALDDNVLPAIQEKFAAAYRAAGGACELTVFEGSEHEWVAQPGPQTDRAREIGTEPKA
jgi:alpha-beta hydrolase superfamily lysophospholipase